MLNPETYTAEITDNKPTVDTAEGKEWLKISRAEWLWAIGFCLSMSMIGLRFPLGYMFVATMLLARFKRNKYDFLIMLTILLGGYGLSTYQPFVVNSAYFVVLAGIGGLILLRKSTILWRASMLWMAYAAILVLFAMLSSESIMHQIGPMSAYLSMVYFMVPVMLFTNEKFDIKEFARKCMPYILVVCAFYIIDGFIMCGWVFAPSTHIWGGKLSTFNNIIAHPLSMAFVRKYPPGMYLLALMIFPAINFFKLKPWHWALIIIGLISTYTFTVMSAVLITYLIYRGMGKKLLKWIGVVVLMFPGLYYVDSLMPEKTIEGEWGFVTKQSTLRIKSSIDQFIDASKAEDAEDLALLGSGRIGQAIPPFLLLHDMGKQWTGFGLLDAKCTNPNLVIYNEFSQDEEELRWRRVNDVEITVAHTILSIGYLGLIVQFVFYFMMWWIIRKYEYSRYFSSALIFFSICGIGGFEGLTNVSTLMLLGLIFGVVLLANRTSTLTNVPKETPEPYHI